MLNEAKLRRINKESVNVYSYADEGASINLTNVKRHMKAGGLLDWGKKKYSGGSSSSTSNLNFFLKLI